MVLWCLGTAAAKQWSKLGSHLKQLNLTFPSVSFRSGIRNDPAFFLVRARHGRVPPPGGAGLALNGDDKRSEVRPQHTDVSSQQNGTTRRSSVQVKIAALRPLPHSSRRRDALQEIEFVPPRVEVRDFVACRF